MNDELVKALAAIALAIITQIGKRYLDKGNHDKQMLDLALEELDDCKEKLRRLRS